MAQEIDLNEKEAKELEAAQEKDVKESQDANHPQEEGKVSINLMTSVIICPVIQYISNIFKSGDFKSDCYDLIVANQSQTITFRGTGEKLRMIKAGILGAMQQNQIYVVEVDEAMGGNNQVIVYMQK